LFKLKGGIAINSPILDDLWQVDSTYNVLWTPTGSIGDTVKIEYSTNGFADELENFPVVGPLGESATTLAAGTNGVLQSFTWKIPDTISNTVTVRVTNNNDAAVLGDSNLMKIVGGFKVLTPNGGTSQFFEVDDWP